jgi:hypothetical protein
MRSRPFFMNAQKGLEKKADCPYWTPNAHLAPFVRL